MKKINETKIERENAIVVTICLKKDDSLVRKTDEINRLCFSADLNVVENFYQVVKDFNKATVIGKGKVQEIKEFISSCEEIIDVVIVDYALTGSQMKNLANEFGVKVIDRVGLIIDIFAKGAKSNEAKLQVKLAQDKYLLPRLSQMQGTSGRFGSAGVGMRGPGETKLETDKRHIRRRIQYLNESLDKIERRRLAMHRRRQKNGVEAVAIVGYTNVGKSTLMNRLTSAGVLEENKLFATLDPTARKLTLTDGREIMLIDTVGLVRRLPHQLVDAFRSTLEEALWADVILNVCDTSSPECNEHIKVTNDLLSSLGCDGKPVINVMNKCDLVPELLDYPLIGRSVCISAKTGLGIDELLEEISTALPYKRRRVTVLVPFSDGSVLSEIRKNGVVYSEEYLENGVKIDALADVSYLDKIKDYIL